MDIKFGTDGWRGLIARDFTFENVGLVAHETAKFSSPSKSSPPLNESRMWRILNIQSVYCATRNGGCHTVQWYTVYIEGHDSWFQTCTADGRER